jgi:hypothetical protein
MSRVDLLIISARLLCGDLPNRLGLIIIEALVFCLFKLHGQHKCLDLKADNFSRNIINAVVSSALCVAATFDP